MSSPQMTRMFGFFCGVWAIAGAHATAASTIARNFTSVLVMVLTPQFAGIQLLVALHEYLII